jgi:hypothetical protein
VCCTGETFSVYRSETSSFFILHQKTLSVLSIYAPLILELLCTFIRVSVTLEWLLMAVTLQMVDSGLQGYLGQVMVTFNIRDVRSLLDWSKFLALSWQKNEFQIL